MSSIHEKSKHNHGLDSEKLTTSGTLEHLLSGTVRRCDYFASDDTDEFQINRENGLEQGIFKVWAAPVIPVLDTHEMDIDVATERWVEDVKDKPLSLYQSLEQWRAFSSIADRRLQQIFESRKIPEEPEEAIAELFARLEISFQYSSPFYNLEALVADTRGNKADNPIDFDQNKSHGGKLDAVAMMLPSALKDLLVSERLNWNDLNWSAIDNQFEIIQKAFLSDEQSEAAQQFILVSKVADLAGLNPKEILFAVNALEFIPADVGGKSDDIPKDIALNTLIELLNKPREQATTNLVAKDMNALIRFLNWCPVIQSEDNFTGKFWSYEAVCGTSSKLLDTLKANPNTAFDEEFASVFTNHLVPQLDGLDATSAKGRFMLQLLGEGRFNKHIEERIQEKKERLDVEVLLALRQIADQEALLEIGLPVPILLNGGKANGLRKAKCLFGEEFVHDGSVLTSEAINSWFATIDGFDELVAQIECSSHLDEKVSVGHEILQKMKGSQVPQNLVKKIQAMFTAGDHIVIRSSSFDEDVDIIGPAPGIYESAVDVDVGNAREIEDGLIDVVGSFFSERALSFREIKGLRNKPIFAVIIQKFIKGPCGSVFVQNGEIKLNVASVPNIVNGVNGNHLVEEHRTSPENDPTQFDSKVLSKTQLNTILWLARKAEAVFGPSDIEFVIDPQTSRVKILQMRSLGRPNIEVLGENEANHLTPIQVNDLDALPELEGSERIDLHIASHIDLDKFQGHLFRWIITHGSNIKMISLEKNIPSTCHFANIVESLGIILSYND